MGYKDVQWYIKDTWIGVNERSIAKQAVARRAFKASRRWAAWNGEIVACS